MAKVLLVDTGFSAAPIYSAIQAYGHEVHVVGANPGAYLAKTAAKWWPIDYADVPALEKLIADEKFDFIVPGCTDRSYKSCALVSRGRFPGIETVENDELLNNKKLFRQFAEREGLPVPGLQDFKPSRLRWPLIVKPVDAFSGRGVTVLLQEDSAALNQAVTAAKNASTTGEFLIEDFVAGQLYSHSAFISSQRVVLDFVVEEHCNASPFAVDTSFVVFDPPSELLNTMRRHVELIASKLSLVDGLFHTQFIMDKRGAPWLIEVTRRCPGDLYERLITLSTGQNYAEAYIRPFATDDVGYRKNHSKRNYVVRHTITSSSGVFFGEVSFVVPIKIISWISLAKSGDFLEKAPHGRAAVFFAKAESHSDISGLIADIRKLSLTKVFGGKQNI